LIPVVFEICTIGNRSLLQGNTHYVNLLRFLMLIKQTAKMHYLFISWSNSCIKCFNITAKFALFHCPNCNCNWTFYMAPFKRIRGTLDASQC